MKISATTFWIALALCIPSASGYAAFVCDTNNNDGRNFTGRGNTQAEAQLEAFNTCNNAGSTSKRNCQVNTQCYDEQQRGHGGRGGPIGPGGPDFRRPQHPGWNRPFRPSQGIFECITSGGDSRTFVGRGLTQQLAQTQAYDTCNGAGSTSKGRCARNMSCSYR